MPTKRQQEPRSSQFVFRIDRELLQQALDKAQDYGGLGAVIRAFLLAFVRGEIEPKPEDLLQELKKTPATRERKVDKR